MLYLIDATKHWKQRTKRESALDAPSRYRLGPWHCRKWVQILITRLLWPTR